LPALLEVFDSSLINNWDDDMWYSIVYHREIKKVMHDAKLKVYILVSLHIGVDLNFSEKANQFPIHSKYLGGG
jgi:hypothetical protein